MNDASGHHVGLASFFLESLDIPKSEIVFLTNRSVRLRSLADVNVISAFSVTGYELFQGGGDRIRTKRVKALSNRLALELLGFDRLLEKAQRIYVLNANSFVLRVLAEWLTMRQRKLSAHLEIHVMYNLGVALKRYGAKWFAVHVSEFWRRTSQRAHATISARCASLAYSSDSIERRREIHRMFGVQAKTFPKSHLAERARQTWWGRLGQPYICLGLGDAKIDKGFLYMPALIEGVFSRHSHMNVLLQAVGGSVAHPRSHHRICGLAEKYGNFFYHDGFLSDWEYLKVLQGSALVVFPYLQESYFSKSSGVLEEALALGVPCVVPAYTELWDIARASDTPAFAFRENSVESILEAIDTALDRLGQSVKRSPEACMDAL
ncbi:MAG: hypothetical protein QNJ44_21245 [Rhodobacter sp.]|nr:hypothetical protein [Rhodobacter sp.]